MKRRIFSELLIKQYRSYFIREHSKFVHASPLKVEDLEKTFQHENREYKIVGFDPDGLVVVENGTNHYLATTAFVFTKLKSEVSENIAETNSTEN